MATRKFLPLLFAALLLPAQLTSQGMAQPHLHADTFSPRSAPADLPKVDFQDIALQAGLHFQHVSGSPVDKQFLLESTGSGVAVIDYDNDGLPDLFFVNGTRWQELGAHQPVSQLFHNRGHLQFEDVTVASGLSQSGWGQGACVGDYDNDGFPDLFVTYYGHNVLYHNDRNGHFTDATAQAGLPTAGRRWGTGCSFVDYDRDGRLDLAIANYLDFDPKSGRKPGDADNCQFKGLPVVCGPHGMKGGVNLLYHNDGAGRFQDVSQRSGFDKPSGFSCFTVLAGDLDGDGWPDLFLACDSTPSILFHNNHDGTFTDAGAASGTAFNADGEEQGSMGADLADIRHTGYLDLVKTNFDDDIPTFYRNDTGGFYTDITYAAGLAGHRNYVGWGAGLLDFDNDGWTDLVMTNGHVYPNVDKAGRASKFRQPKQLYWNDRQSGFFDISNQSGPGISSPNTGRGLAYADLDNNGSLEIVINNLDGPPSLLVNRIRYANHWLLLRLAGTQSNRSAIGARVTLVTGGIRQTAEVRGGCCYLSQSDLRLHFGLGSNMHVDSLEVQWPSGSTERFAISDIDRVVDIQEGSGKPATD